MNPGWMDTLLLIADRAGDTAEPDPMLAFRLARASEQVHRQNDHEFRWFDVSARFARLCNTSALAISGRWQDRRTVDLAESLGGFLSTSVEQGGISVGQALTLWTLAPGWKRNSLLDACLAREGDPASRQTLFDSFVRHASLFAPDYRSVQSLRSIADRHGLCSPALNALGRRPPDPETDRQMEKDRQYRSQDAIEQAVEPISGDFTSTEAIERVMADWRSSHRFMAREHLARAMADAVPVRDRGAHIDAWLGVRELSAIDVLISLRELRKHWDKPAMRKLLDAGIQVILERDSDELITSGFSLGFIFGRHWNESEAELQPDLHPLLDATVRQVEWIEGEKLFGIAQEVAVRLDTNGAKEALGFGLRRLEKMPTSGVGDGEWQERFSPPAQIENAIAGLLWARLGAPEPSADTL